MTSEEWRRGIMSVSFYPNWLQCYQNTEHWAAGAEKCSCAHFGALQSPPGVDVRPMSSLGLRSIRLKRGPTNQACETTCLLFMHPHIQSDPQKWDYLKMDQQPCVNHWTTCRFFKCSLTSTPCLIFCFQDPNENIPYEIHCSMICADLTEYMFHDPTDILRNIATPP